MGAPLTDQDTATCRQQAYQKYQKTWLPQILQRETCPIPWASGSLPAFLLPTLGAKSPKGKGLILHPEALDLCRVFFVFFV